MQMPGVNQLIRAAETCKPNYLKLWLSCKTASDRYGGLQASSSSSPTVAVHRTLPPTSTSARKWRARAGGGGETTAARRGAAGHGSGLRRPLTAVGPPTCCGHSHGRRATKASDERRGRSYATAVVAQAGGPRGTSAAKSLPSSYGSKTLLQGAVGHPCGWHAVWSLKPLSALRDLLPQLLCSVLFAHAISFDGHRTLQLTNRDRQFALRPLCCEPVLIVAVAGRIRHALVFNGLSSWFVLSLAGRSQGRRGMLAWW